jgi:hypothetical protein
MLNMLISVCVAMLVGVLTYIGLGSGVAASVPAVLVFGVCFFLIARSVGNRVTREMNHLVPMLQSRKTKEAEAHLLVLKKRYGPWQFLLKGQLDAQRGMIRYMQMKYDDAMPLLMNGKFRNWAALVSIGCIHHRNGAKSEAWNFLEKASRAATKEPMVYVIWATLLTRSGERPKALEVLAGAQKTLPDNALIGDLKKTIANRKKIDAKRFPQSWYQFFPEDMMKQMVRGRRGGPGENVVYQSAPHPTPKVSKKMRRGG